MQRTIGNRVIAFLGAGALITSLGGSPIEARVAEQQIPAQQEKVITMRLSKIPSSVLGRYKELEVQYGGLRKRSSGVLLGTRLAQCIKGREKIFEVSSMRTFGGVDYYYTTGGRYIRHDRWSDTNLEPLARMQGYKCTTIRVVE